MVLYEPSAFHLLRHVDVPLSLILRVDEMLD
jgi:hypothetical protein